MVIIMAVLIILTVVVLIGFRIRSVSVTGNEIHTGEEIRDALMTDTASQNSLYFTWKYRHAVEDPRTPYLDSIQAKLMSPGSVKITVEEKKPIGRILYGGQYVYFDANALVLETTVTVREEYPLITGVSCDEPELYQKLPVTNAAVLRTILTICELMENCELQTDQIEFDENNNITIIIDDVRVEIGQDEYLEQKIANLPAVYSKVEGQSGVMDMTGFTGKKDDQITFRTDVETEAETEPETEAPSEQDGYIDDSGNYVDNWNESQNQSSGQDTYQDPYQETYEDPNQSQGPVTGEVYGMNGFMVFDSYGTLRYDARVIGGQVVDSYGNPIPGCYVDEYGYVMDAYYNQIDPMTGQPINLG